MKVKKYSDSSIYESSIKRRTSKLIASIASGVLIIATIGLAACAAGPYTEASGLPNKLLTPGAINPAVTQANIHSNIYFKFDLIQNRVEVDNGCSQGL